MKQQLKKKLERLTEEEIKRVQIVYVSSPCLVQEIDKSLAKKGWVMVYEDREYCSIEISYLGYGYENGNPILYENDGKTIRSIWRK